MGETSKNEIKSIKQSILEIDFDPIDLNESGSLTFWRFGTSNNISILYWEILSNVTERVQRKLLPPEVMDVRFGRSTKQIISNHFISTSHCQRTWGNIASSIKCNSTECNGL